MKSLPDRIRRRLNAVIPPLDPRAFRQGARAMSAPAIAIAIWGFVTGVAMVNRGLPAALAIVMTLVAFAGSAQLATLPLLAVGAPLPIVWVTALLVNLRFMIFSAASRAFFAQLTPKQRLFSAYLNGDLGFALFMREFATDETKGSPEQWGYFYGGAAVNWVVWQVTSIAGILLGGLAPTTWGLELAALLALVAVLIPMANHLPGAVGVVVTALLSTATVKIPMRLGLIISVLVGVLVAVAAENVRDRAQLARSTAVGVREPAA